MLVLSRKENEEVYIDGGRIIVTVVHTARGAVKLGFQTPPGMTVDRKEVHLYRVRERCASHAAAGKERDTDGRPGQDAPPRGGS